VLSLAVEIGERRAIEILRTHTTEDPC
jgi:hypothetical protein